MTAVYTTAPILHPIGTAPAGVAGGVRRESKEQRMGTLIELVSLAGIGAMALWLSVRAAASRKLTPIRVPVTDPTRRPRT